MRSNARKRAATWIESDRWLVTGGENQHTVIAGQFNKPETFKCDCGISDKHPDHLCSHILAVMREM
jgi:endonuclease/exonuclease/phosphatase family metal-dependent hydrolase